MLLLGILLSSTLAARPAVADDWPLPNEFDKALAGVPGMVSVVVVDLQTGYRYAHAPTAPVEAASLFKLFVMAAVYMRAQDDPAALKNAVPVMRPHASGGVVALGVDSETVNEALGQMIDWSDNAPTAALVDLLGIEEINATVAALGFQDTIVRSGAPSGNTTTARDVARFFTLIAQRRLISPEASDAMMWTLMHQGINDRLSKGMPSGALIAHKTGNSADACHDAGIVWTPSGQRIVVVLTARIGGDDARALIEQIGYLVYSLPAPEVD